MIAESKQTAPRIPLQFASAARRPAWVTGSMDTPGGPVWKIATAWSRQDRWGQVRSRVSAYRMSYRVSPGLYAVGDPGPGSPVFASANYKLSFDILRRSLAGIDGWVLVLDTKGINVWCAAGKGTFGTEEMILRIRGAQLDRVVSHRRIIAPQLGAPGVNAAVVARETGFRVLFGPVEARDIRAYLAAGDHAGDECGSAADAGVDRDGAELAVLAAGAALHAPVAVRDDRAFVLHLEHAVGADLYAPAAAFALFRVVGKACNIRKIPHISCHSFIFMIINNTTVTSTPAR